MGVKEIAEDFIKHHKFSTPAQLSLVAIIKDNLKIVEEATEALETHHLLNDTPYGIIKAHGALIPHPSYKMKAEAQKVILSCFRQFDIKPEKKEKEKPKGLSSLMKKAS